MDFKLAVLCEDAAITGVGNINVHRTFRHLWAGAFPHQHPRMVLVCTVAIPDAFDSDHFQLAVDFIDPDGRRLDRVLDAIQPCEQNGQTRDMLDFTVELRNLVFEAPGAYQFSIFINGDLVQAVGLNLHRA